MIAARKTRPHAWPTNKTQRDVIISMLAIHDSRSGFHPHWIEYCRKNGIPHKVVDCYASNIVEQLEDCRALLWHHSHSDPRDIRIARQILFALEHAGLTVFPDFRTAWHFDDKVGQKYLFEALDIPRLPTYVFVEKTRHLSGRRQLTIRRSSSCGMERVHLVSGLCAVSVKPVD